MKRKKRKKRYPSEEATYSEWASHLCINCGRCCIQSPIPVLNDEEGRALYSVTGSAHSYESFCAEYLREIDWEASQDIPDEQIFKGGDGSRPKYLMMGTDGKCPFLFAENQEYKCMAYSKRPEACRTFNCKPLMWLQRFFVTGLLTFTAKPDSVKEAAITTEECIEETNAMMIPPGSTKNFDPKVLIKEKSFEPSIYSWNREIPQSTELRRTEYLHELPRRDGE